MLEGSETGFIGLEVKGKESGVIKDGLENGGIIFCISIRDYIHFVDTSEEIHTSL